MVGRARWTREWKERPPEENLCPACKRVEAREKERLEQAMYDPNLFADEEGF
jgi:hypothetical protein